ncbi:uncharacterized protein LY89DRAFT_188107 [Mollisia scopiformis]|uniref:Apple domain-containing protein n=1 Tax=Mollisia scopiformis TaxID=149040 RepID=A0A194XU15_MOLSC|nr:uncharacterized protein LY89DRAFT_188107 [Mollisia scopiformis]KUJ23631.1 hypothetical protein LY89DRAFT_188107 [Mollisia scopiformis]
MAVMTRTCLFLVLTVVSFQSPLNYVKLETESRSVVLSPLSSDHSNAFNSNENVKQATAKMATKTDEQSPSLVLQERASSTPTIYIKFNASDCNIEGSVGSAMTPGALSTKPTDLNSVLDCQMLCQRTATCYSYSWQTTTESACRCTMYNTWIGHTPGAVDTGETGIWFSDKHVVDGTIWCYSSTPFMASGIPGTPIIIT